MKLTDLIYTKCNLCSCGSIYPAMKLLEMLRKCSKEIPIETKYIENELALKVLDSSGLITHGSGMSLCWLTDSGRELLTEIDHLLDEVKSNK
jgi:hypothetical protein